jgi:hypothetical protein
MAPLSFAHLLLCGSALATEPVPDRPMATHSGYLIAARSLELEAGGRWQDGFTVPARIKLGAARILEPRLAFDLSGVDGGHPDLWVEGKVGLIQEEGIGLALLAGSAFPIADGERWEGTLRALMTLPFDRFSLRANLGGDLYYDGEGVRFGGVPMLASAHLPFTASVGAFLEAGTIAGAGWDQALLDGGLTWRLTEIMVLDTAVGWDIAAGSPFVQAGMTANLGRIGG